MQRHSRQLLLAALSVVFHAASYQVQADEPHAREFSWHASEVTGLAFVPNGTRLISTSLRDDRISTIVPGAEALSSIGNAGAELTGARSHAVAVSPDGTQVAIAGFQATTVYDLNTRREQWQMSTTHDDYSPPFVIALAFSPDGQKLATSGSSSRVGGPHGYKGGLISIRDAASGDELLRIDNLSHTAGSIAYSPDGKLLVAGTYGAGGELPEPGELRLWDASSGELKCVWKAKDAVRADENHAAFNEISFSPDSRVIAIASSDGPVRLWDVAAEKVASELKGHSPGANRVVFHPAGRILASAGRDRTIRLWDVQSTQQIASFRFESPKINALRFSPDGNILAAGGGDFLRDGNVRVWNVQDLNQQ